MKTPKDVALSFMRALWAGDLAAAETLLAPDATWVFQLGMPYAQKGRVWNAREAMRRIAEDLFSAFDPEEGFEVEVLSAIAEGDEVAIEYSASGTTGKGRPYRNYYVARLTIHGDVVQQLRPYNDTKHMYQELGG